MSEEQKSPVPQAENYEIGRQLASGGMGSVMLAEDRKLGRQVALKALSFDAWSDPSLRRRFVREAQVLAHLAHPNIVPIHDLVWEDGIPQFYTMKLVQGRSLQEILDALRQGDREMLESFRLESLLTIFLKVCDAIGFAHSQGVIHRDLKPDNIMVGEFGEVLVMDWGLAGLIDDLGARRITTLDEGLAPEDRMEPVELTMQGAVLGTPRYMSPEQAASRLDEVGPASDIFSLGGILYAILTLQPPVEGNSVQEVLEKLAKGEILSPAAFSSLPGRRRSAGGTGKAGPMNTRTHCPGGKMPPALSAVAMQALALDPADRYRSAELVAADITAYQNGFATSAQEVRTFGQLVLLMKRHKTVTTALAIILFLSVGFMIKLAASAKAERRVADIERRTAYSATLAQALAARSHHDFGQARRLLNGIEEQHRGFDWRLLHGLCGGDELHSFRLGEGAGSEPQCLDFLQERSQIAIISADGRLHLRDLEGREIVPPRRLPPLPLDSNSIQLQRYEGLTYAPNGQRLAYANGDVLQVLEAEALTVLHEETSRKPQFAWLDDDRLLYGFNGSVEAPPFPEAGAWILELGRGKGSDGSYPRTAFPEMCAPLAVSPDRAHFVLHWVNTAPTSWERRLNVFPVSAKPGERPTLTYTMPGLEYPGLLAFSQSGRYLAFTGGLYRYLSRSARVLEIPSGRLLFDQDFGDRIHGIAIDPEERRLAVVSDDSVVRLYDFTRGVPEENAYNTYDDEVALSRSQPVVGAAAHAPPRDLLTRSARDGRARFLLGHEGRVFDLAFGPAGSLLTAGAGGSVRQWAVADSGFRTPAVRIGHMEHTYDQELPTASVDGSKVLYHAASTAYLCDVPASYPRLEPAIRTVGTRHAPLAVLDNGRAVTLARDKSLVVVWKEVEGVHREERTFRDLAGKLPGVGRARGGKLSRDQTRLAGALPGQLFTVDLESGHLVASPDFVQRTGPQGVASHDLSPDGRWIAASGLGPRVSIHPFEDPGQIVTHLGGPGRDFDTAVVFGRDGALLYTGNEDGRVRVWNTDAWTEIPELGFAAHRGAVTALAVSHDGTLLATSGDDTLKLFPIEPEPGITYRRPRLSFQIEQPASWIHFARAEDGSDRALLHSSPGRTLEIWEADRLKSPPSRSPRQTGPSPDLPRAVGNHSMETLPDGRVLVAGGEGRNDIGLSLSLSHCYLFDPATATWSVTGSLHHSRCRFPRMAVLPGGKVLAAGGLTREGLALRSCELYDPERGRWEITGSMQNARGACGLVALPDGKVLAIGGTEQDGSHLQSCERYDPATGRWTAAPSMTQASGPVNAVALQNGNVFVLARVNNPGAPPVCELYDSTLDRWTLTRQIPLPNGLERALLAPLGESGELLLVGGALHDGRRLRDCWRYDPRTDSWSQTGSMATPADPAFSSLVSLPDGRILVAGGKTTNNGPGRGAEFYDPSTGQWTPAPDLAIPRTRSWASLLKDGRVLFAGGADDKGLTNRVEVYQP